MSGVRTLIISICIVLSVVAVASAQHVPIPATVSQGRSMGSIPVTIDDGIQRQQAIAANEQRQVEIKRDMEKMAELTQELKEYLARASQGVMSVDAIKKAE